MHPYLKIAIEAALLAGKEIMNIYARNFEVEFKDDTSPLTEADKVANTVIVKLLKQTPFPIISEESRQLPYETRKGWETCWIVDPLDGTKEFVKKNGEFTVNIALVKKGVPVMGVILVPALDLLYFATVSEGKAYKVFLNGPEPDIDLFFANLACRQTGAEPITPKNHPSKTRVVGSRSHMNDETLGFMEQLKGDGKKIEIVSKGSSLKFCLIAEGAADYYPRFAPTMEWDTAAGQAICNAVAIAVTDMKTGSAMLYNKENLLNNFFLVTNENLKNVNK